MDILKVIKNDHKVVKGLLKDLYKSRSGKSKTKEMMMTKLNMELKAHMEAEEKLFYPSLINEKDSREPILEGLEEHRLTKMVMSELNGLSMDDELFAVKLKVVKDLVEHHIEEEEKEILVKVQKHLSKEERNKMGDEFESIKEKTNNMENSKTERVVDRSKSSKFPSVMNINPINEPELHGAKHNLK